MYPLHIGIRCSSSRYWDGFAFFLSYFSFFPILYFTVTCKRRSAIESCRNFGHHSHYTSRRYNYYPENRSCHAIVIQWSLVLIRFAECRVLYLFHLCHWNSKPCSIICFQFTKSKHQYHSCHFFYNLYQFHYFIVAIKKIREREGVGKIKEV